SEKPQFPDFLVAVEGGLTYLAQSQLTGRIDAAPSSLARSLGLVAAGRRKAPLSFKVCWAPSMMPSSSEFLDRQHERSVTISSASEKRAQVPWKLVSVECPFLLACSFR